jgi:hypothetical protein
VSPGGDSSATLFWTLRLPCVTEVRVTEARVTEGIE